MAADALSDLLKAVRLTGAAYFDVTARAPWVAEQPARERILPLILERAENLIAYHVVTEGRCVANIVGEPPIPLEAGDIIVFTRGDPHVLSSSPGMRARADGPDPIGAAAGNRLPFVIDHGSDGPVAAKFICGFLACDARPFNPLLDNLPPVIKTGVTTGWLDQLIRLAIVESQERRAGGEGVLAKLSELMFIEVVRRYLDGLPPERAGWLAGLRDPFVGKALSLIHSDVEADWTIESLARSVGVSRSVLAERFTALVGMPPMHYLARWRMQIAARLLTQGINIAAIAADVGYGSEAAFSRAFKKLVGMSPSDWRSRAS